MHADAVLGWSPQRSVSFGATCLHAIYQVLASMGEKLVGVAGKRGAEAPAAGEEAGVKRAKEQC